MHRHMAPTYGAYKLPVFTTHTYKKWEMPFCVQNALETTLAVPPKTHWENNSVPQILLKDSRGEPKFRKKRKGWNKAKKGMQKEKTKQKKRRKNKTEKEKLSHMVGLKSRHVRFSALQGVWLMSFLRGHAGIMPLFQLMQLFPQLITLLLFLLLSTTCINLVQNDFNLRCPINAFMNRINCN